MTFWIVGGILVVALVSWLAHALMRAGPAAADAPVGMQVYRDQLAEVDRDLARGVLSEEAAERVRAEVGRRILAADRAAKSATGGVGAPRGAVLAGLGFVALALAGAIALYEDLGVPDLRDMPLSDRIEAAETARAARPPQAEAEAAIPPQVNPDADPRLVELVDKLREILKTREGDVEGLTLLARNEAALGNFAQARAAQERLIAAKGTAATVDDLVGLAELMVFAAGGLVTTDTDRVLAAILEADPDNSAARYYVGLMHAQTGRADLAFSFWRVLLEQGPEDAPWIPPIRASIRALAAEAGVDYTPPPVAMARGPSAADIDAAGEMTAEDRSAMIRGMVDGLAERLGAEGGPPEDWARLISALGVLGETDRAAAIWAEAQQVFAATPEALAVIRQGAENAGVAE